jgi:hypothetical protein
VHRDVREVVVSWMQKNELPFSELVESGSVDTLLANDALWTSQPGMLVSRYETMAEDLGAEVDRIAAHLDIDLTPSASREIAQKYTLPRPGEIPTREVDAASCFAHRFTDWIRDSFLERARAGEWVETD